MNVHSWIFFNHIFPLKLLHPPPLWTVYPFDIRICLADPLRMPEAQHVIIVLFFGILFNDRWISERGILTEFFMCPVLYSPTVLTSTITAPSFTNCLKSTCLIPNNLPSNPIIYKLPCTSIQEPPFSQAMPNDLK